MLNRVYAVTLKNVSEAKGVTTTILIFNLHLHCRQTGISTPVNVGSYQSTAEQFKKGVLHKGESNAEADCRVACTPPVLSLQSCGFCAEHSEVHRLTRTSRDQRP